MAHIREWLFPSKVREFKGQRWLNICLRSLHLVGIAGIGAGFLFELSEAQWLPYWHLAIVTGIVLSVLYLWSTALWLFQIKGLAIIVKLALLWMATVQPDIRGELFILIILISGISAHAPGSLRLLVAEN